MGAETIRKDNASAREKRGQCSADQPMPVQQRHDDQAGVSGAQLIMRRNMASMAVRPHLLGNWFIVRLPILGPTQRILLINN